MEAQTRKSEGKTKMRDRVGESMDDITTPNPATVSLHAYTAAEAIKLGLNYLGDCNGRRKIGGSEKSERLNP